MKIILLTAPYRLRFSGLVRFSTGGGPTAPRRVECAKYRTPSTANDYCRSGGHQCRRRRDVEGTERTSRNSNGGGLGPGIGGGVGSLNRARARASLASIDVWEEQAIPAPIRLHGR
jgi:hypothetical protein